MHRYQADRFLLIPLLYALLMLSLLSMLPMALGGCATTQGKPLAFEMNMRAVFEEDDVIAAGISESVEGLLGVITRGESFEGYVDQAEQQRHTFFYKALRSLATPGDTSGRSPLVLKSFSPDGGQSYLISVAFMRGEQIYKIIEFHAYRDDGSDGYRFKSPFDYRTRALRVQGFDEVRYYSTRPIDVSRAEAFVGFKHRLEGLLDVGPEVRRRELSYYCFETLDELLRAYGIVYDCTRCNWLKEDLGFMDAGADRFLTGSDDERYVFAYTLDFMQALDDGDGDLFPPMVYGLATYFGGYGLSGHDLPTLKDQFRQRLAAEPGIDFLVEFNKGRGSSVSRHFTYFVICSFLCEAVAERHGMNAVIDLVHSGRSGGLFFAQIEKLLGVDEAGFHDLVVRLIGSK
tara:strand:- start:48425 stop:49630 length:1206 start_codon:yes stop_codon:yes gene_type:complete